MAMQNPREFFLHELSDIYQAEQMILKTLPEMAKAAQDPAPLVTASREIDRYLEGFGSFQRS